MTGPLSGLTVLDLTTVIAGPYATQMLGDMGAEIIKIEGPAGDIMRAPGPARSAGMGAAFLNCNRNKENLCLDLKKPADLARLAELLSEADVFVHNMRMKAARRLRLDPETLADRYPRLVYCAITGFGQDGPYRDRPAYDDIIQAASGWASLAADADEAPSYAPTIVADKTAGLHAVSAITAALFHRERTGEGQAIEVPMFEAMVSFLAIEHLAGQSFVPSKGPCGYSRLLTPWRRPYRAADGYIAVMPYTASHWSAFFQASDRADWAADPALADDAERAASIGQLYERLADCLKSRTVGEWVSLLDQLQIPCSPVNRLDDLPGDEHVRATGLFLPVDHPTEGEMITVRPPVRFSRTPCSIRTLAPAQKGVC
ncbi:CaiB/BaiF CoA transferase family protein [Paracoccus aerodenitrificans]|uniref:CaiB/BaiF CoA transferase family protein n=1 Tax=Paracoccus aerodenitrificans TaxID=3017781 RepID=UPI0022F10E98|nr:CoA transferase [Paracoccus aerodenitrificans]WBU63642.1 CoA transferase [Paracoccus aerodenitrificans]